MSDMTEHHIDKMIAGYEQQIEMLKKLKRSLAQQKQDDMNGRPTIGLNPDNIKGLRAAYNKAVDAMAESFTYGGNEFVTNYAKYVLEYYDSARKVKTG